MVNAVRVITHQTQTMDLNFLLVVSENNNLLETSLWQCCIEVTVDFLSSRPTKCETKRKTDAGEIAFIDQLLA
uniref:Uncharacterized protein n=1 Tax=Rhizophora mucronata TaxID=61149 RepID=A0A2P2IW38_RHIMU